MLEKDRGALVDLLSERLGTALPADASITVRCPTLEARYGRQTPWLPWNHPALADEPRRLINPRKTPLTIVDGEGAPLWHLRFIGEGPWGLAEQAQLSTAKDDETAHFVDGYRATPHRPQPVPLAERLVSATPVCRSTLLTRAAARLASIIDRSKRASGDAEPAQPVATLRARLNLLAERFELPTLPALADGLREASAGGVAGGWALYTSLRYAHGSWHWQVDAAGTVLRFQQETSWGGASYPALEIASFAMEHALDPAETALVAVHSSVSPAAVADSAAAAMLVAVEAVCRGVRRVDATGPSRLHDDLAARRAWIAQAVGF